MTKPQRRMLSILLDGNSHRRLKLLAESGSHNSGYRVMQALKDGGFISTRLNVDGHWYEITPAGRAALATP